MVLSTKVPSKSMATNSLREASESRKTRIPRKARKARKARSEAAHRLLEENQPPCERIAKLGTVQLPSN